MPSGYKSHYLFQHTGDMAPEEFHMGSFEFFRFINTRRIEQCVFFFLCCLSACISLMVGRGGYSGEASPPMFGDYEAQRHWMEITWNLPVKDWYVNGTSNDLQYWGLDYPPLTAFHSLALGTASNWWEPGSVALHSSRGYETAPHKHFMRMTAATADWLVFYPAVWYFVHVGYARGTPRLRASVCAALLLFPSKLLIDHGHFQYNSVALGLVLWALGFQLADRPYAAAVAFTLALCYKQTMLYFSTAIFFALLGEALKLRTWTEAIWRVAMLGAIVVGVLVFSFAPFLDPQQLRAVISRVFPFDRGLYEDHVANVWVLLSPLLKLRQLAAASLVAQRRMMLGSTFATLLGMAPSCCDLVLRGFKSQPERLLFAFGSCALSFFLFSWQIHEKAILLPTLPLLCLPRAGVPQALASVGLSVLWGLLARDGQLLNALLLAAFALVAHGWLDGRPSLPGLAPLLALPPPFHRAARFWDALGPVCLLLTFLPAPARLPYLWSLVQTCHAAVWVVLLWLWATHQQLALGRPPATVTGGRGGSTG